MRKLTGLYPSFYSRTDRVERLLTAAHIARHMQRNESYNAAIKELERLLDHPDRECVVRLLAKRSRSWSKTKRVCLVAPVFTESEKEMFL
jgi:hypothetical protein